MSMGKAYILGEIRRTAALNGGKPLGIRKFENETGIRFTDWHGKHWVRWEDAVREAGFEPNQMNSAYDDQYLLQRYAELALELGHIPVTGELKIKRRSDPSFPSKNVFRRLGTKATLLQQLAEFCRSNRGFEKVAEWCDRSSQTVEPQVHDESTAASNIGYVYMIKHGSRREYRIGCTDDPLRREGEIRIQLPERITPIHTILTDDRYGIEAYWHRRFAAKKKNGDWFALNQSDVNAFKRWKRIW